MSCSIWVEQWEDLRRFLCAQLKNSMNCEAILFPWGIQKANNGSTFQQQTFASAGGGKVSKENSYKYPHILR